MICASTIAAPSLNFYLVARAIEFPIADIDTKTKWLARWVGLGTTVVRKATALEAERFGGPKGKNESKNRM